jgi:nucleoid-associated protein YgaU
MVYSGSRYARTGMYMKSGATGLLKMRRRAAFSKARAAWRTWASSDTLPGLAWGLYGNAQLWWAIMDANPQYQFEGEIKPGDVIMVPDFEEVARLA